MRPESTGYESINFRTSRTSPGPQWRRLGGHFSLRYVDRYADSFGTRCSPGTGNDAVQLVPSATSTATVRTARLQRLRLRSCCSLTVHGLADQPSHWPGGRIPWKVDTFLANSAIIGIRANKPYIHREDFLHNYFGMIGIQLTLIHFPDERKLVRLTESARFDPGIVPNQTQ